MIRGEEGSFWELEQESASPAPSSRKNRETVPDMQGVTEFERLLLGGMTRFLPNALLFLRQASESMQ
ncbi:hypothetical protein HMPREF3038_00034 [Akkermansia sp. KLE1797]|nr:hypothetical protein HMPREF3038_00034 [Akkermansia sp. KLE1797]KXU55689.1 hypothetical protein HMPREF3039_00042 [Akkermansia sp. KLE1798]KZA05242.1 hypothetical protein HMPREF1326_01002 [Akkermansia sp. KLE1605]